MQVAANGSAIAHDIIEGVCYEVCRGEACQNTTGWNGGQIVANSQSTVGHLGVAKSGSNDTVTERVNISLDIHNGAVVGVTEGERGVMGIVEQILARVLMVIMVKLIARLNTAHGGL